MFHLIAAIFFGIVCMGIAFIIMAIGGNLIQVKHCSLRRRRTNTLKPEIKPDAVYIMKLKHVWCFILGLLTDMVYFHAFISQLSGSLFGIAIGPLLGVFVLGALFPFANWIVSICDTLIMVHCSTLPG